MKPQELKNIDKTRAKKEGGKRMAIKNQTEKGEKTIKRSHHLLNAKDNKKIGGFVAYQQIS
jgi:hypothetical protein